MDWEQCSVTFVWDGGLREINLYRATLPDWARLLEFLRSYEPLISSDALLSEPLPRDAAQLFESEDSNWPSVSFPVGELRVNCFFFLEEQIELNMDPREVTSQARLNTLVDFLQKLGDAVGLPVAFTGCHELPLFTYDPTQQIFLYHEPPGR